MKKFLLSTLLAAIIAMASGRAEAVTMTIGDVDGFGFTSTTGLVSAQGGPADTDGDGMIEPGEYLPDLNGNGSVAWDTGDNFDNRLTDEFASTTGGTWTDVSLSHGFGKGLADDAEFTFNFAVPTVGDADYGVDHYVNFVFGDYDVYPMTSTVEGTTISFTLQGGNEDGLVKIAYATVNWFDMLDGTVSVSIIAPNEPYVAFDYALLDTEILTESTLSAPTTNVPEPATLLLTGAGLAGAALLRRRKS